MDLAGGGYGYVERYPQALYSLQSSVAMPTRTRSTAYPQIRETPPQDDHQNPDKDGAQNDPHKDWPDLCGRVAPVGPLPQGDEGALGGVSEDLDCLLVPLYIHTQEIADLT